MEYWNLNHWMSFWALVIALLGVLASSIFSFLLWKATKRSTEAAELSAKAAMQSIEFSTQVNVEKGLIHKARHDQALNELKIQAIQIMSIFMDLHSKMGALASVNRHDFDQSLKKPDSSYQHEYFTPDETEIIDDAWQKLAFFILRNPAFTSPNAPLSSSIQDVETVLSDIDEILDLFEKVKDL